MSQDVPALSDPERRFVEAYLAHGRNGARAWRAALDPEAGRSASARAAAFLRRPAVARALEEAEARARAHTEAVLERYALTNERVLEELTSVAFSRPLDLMRLNPDGTAVVDLSTLDDHQAAAIAEVTVDEFMDGKGPDARPVRRMRVRLADKLRALNLLGQRLGLWKPDGRAKGDAGSGTPNEGHGLSALLDEAARLAQARAEQDSAPNRADPA
ncbi:terminase small subunit [Pararhodospirillum oryzae]|uniref:Terminase small subunit n=1 Tax=Pararhodospirillum oryzae TaxID=478448 RepID=A0A512H4U9_9PROT|nr:terminase small subunit [Pararhodospirillum oryzae]GEO80448.1 hypothetical protein ROR02_05790 [Pararhodospirillum oryzae]